MKLLKLLLRKLLIMCSIAVLLPTGIKGFGNISVKGFNLEPIPPDIMTIGDLFLLRRFFLEYEIELIVKKSFTIFLSSIIGTIPIKVL